MAFNNSSNFQTTQYNVVVGAALGGIANIAPSATAGHALLSNGASANPSFLSVFTGSFIPITNVSSSPYTVLAADYFLAVSTASARTIQLPNSPTTGRVYVIKDSTGQGGTNNISVTTVGGVVTIDGLTTYTINANYQSISVVFNGTSYMVF